MSRPRHVRLVRRMPTRRLFHAQSGLRCFPRSVQPGVLVTDRRPSTYRICEGGRLTDRIRTSAGFLIGSRWLVATSTGRRLLTWGGFKNPPPRLPTPPPPPHPHPHTPSPPP